MPVGGSVEKGFSISLWEQWLAEGARKRERERYETLRKVRKSLWEYFAPKKVKAVYLLGSLVREGAFSLSSDIDIAVEGFNGDYFRALCELEEVLQRDVDLIELEKCPFRDRILKEGIRVL